MASWGFLLNKGMKLEVEVDGKDQCDWAEPQGPNRFVPTTPPTQDFEVRKRTTSDKEREYVRGKKIRVNGPKFHEDSGAPSPNYVFVDLEDPIPPAHEPINIAPLAVVAPNTAPSGGRTPRGYWREEGTCKLRKRAS